MKINKVLSAILLAALIILIFPFLFLANPIVGGDYLNFWPENLLLFKNYAFSAWNSETNLGWNVVGLLHYAPYSFFEGWIGSLLGYNIFLWERVVWWLPFFSFSFFSTYFLFKTIFPQNKFWFFAPIIFIFNTYIFMILGGGQIAGIGLAYSIAPVVLAAFIKLISANKDGMQQLKLSILSGLLFAVLVVLDLRIAYVTLLAVFLYLVFSIWYLVSKRKVREALVLFFYSFIIPLGITGFLHAFWIIPTVLFRVNTIEQLGTAYSSLNAVKFFSFATFENSLSLLHPNWPENLFGKTYFMRPEFLILPILAYSSLLFISNVKSQNSKRKPFNHRIILFFALLGLVGAFLAKGANDPFGQVYLWLFDHVPGFIMFRDPTKWYLLVALSYSILIPFTVWQIYEWIKEKNKFSIFNFQFPIKSKIFNLPNIFLFFVFCALLFLIRPAFTQELSGTFRIGTMPYANEELKVFLSNDTHFSRVLWLPRRDKFAYFTGTHPAIDADTFLRASSASGVLAVLKNRDNEKHFQEAGIKYVVLPSDLQKELFLKDNKYSEKLHQQFKKELDRISWLKKSQNFGTITVYEIDSPKDKFWVKGTGEVTYQTINPTMYTVFLSNAKKGDLLIFNERYDPYWQAINPRIKYKVSSIKYQKEYNSFVLQKDGDYEVEIYYTPQKWVNLGLVISTLTFVLCLGSLVVLRRK